MCENLETLEKMRKIQTCFLNCKVPNLGFEKYHKNYFGEIEGSSKEREIERALTLAFPVG